MDTKRLLRLGLLLPILLALSGCFQMDSTLRFAEGTVKPEIVMHISHQLVSIDQEITLDEFRAFDGEKRQEFCEAFMDTEAGMGSEAATPVTATSASVTEDGFDSEGWLICRATSDAVPISDLNDDSFTVDYTDGTYTVNSLLEEVLGDTAEGEVEISPSQLKEMGVEASMTLAFTGEITNAALNSVEFGTEDEPTGVILTNNSITLDLFEVSGDLNVVGTDEVAASASNITDYAPFLLVILVILAGVFLLLKRKRKTAASTTSATANSALATEEVSENSDGDEDTLPNDADEDVSDNAKSDDEDLLALASQYEDPTDRQAVDVENTDEATSEEAAAGETLSPDSSETEPVESDESDGATLLEDDDPELDALVAEYTRGEEFDGPVSSDGASEVEEPAEVESGEPSMFFPTPEEDDGVVSSDAEEGTVEEHHGYEEVGLPDPDALPVDTSQDPRFEGNPFRKQ